MYPKSATTHKPTHVQGRMAHGYLREILKKEFLITIGNIQIESEVGFLIDGGRSLRELWANSQTEDFALCV